MKNNIRQGLGKGRGVGYYNLMPMDKHIHSLSAKGVKTTQKLLIRTGGDSLHDIPERNKILNEYWDKDLELNINYPDKWMGGTRHFRLLPLDNVKKLMEKEYLSPDDTQNESPTAQEFLNFMTRWKRYGVTAHGYAYAKERKDDDVTGFPKDSVTIEGLEIWNPIALNDVNFVRAWYEFNNGADELNKNRSWWD